MKKTINKLLGIPPFNAERQLKSKLANSMWVDANDFNWKADILLKNLPHETKSYFGKVYVDLMMGIESSLKSLIISLSAPSITPEDAYINARNKGHKIDALYTEVQKLAKKRVKLLSKLDLKILDEAKTLSVNNRYELITFLLFIQEDSLKRILHADKISSILNEEFLGELLKVAIRLSNIAKKSIKKYCDFPGMSGTQAGILDKRTKLFYTTLSASKKL